MTTVIFMLLSNWTKNWKQEILISLIYRRNTPRAPTIRTSRNVRPRQQSENISRRRVTSLNTGNLTHEDEVLLQALRRSLERSLPWQQTRSPSSPLSENEDHRTTFSDGRRLPVSLETITADEVFLTFPGGLTSRAYLNLFSNGPRTIFYS